MSEQTKVPYTALSTESIEILAKLKLNKAEKERVISSVLEDMTYEKTMLFFKDICEKYPTKKSSTVLDKILWYVHHAYMSGFANALDVYSESIDDVIRRPQHEEVTPV